MPYLGLTCLAHIEKDTIFVQALDLQILSGLTEIQIGDLVSIILYLGLFRISLLRMFQINRSLFTLMVKHMKYLHTFLT